ncbi:MAG: mannose-1-phosphate guanylyltransferase [Planctomycetota bacterium]|jgi:mannose-1-phosphate guanylyltransferase
MTIHAVIMVGGAGTRLWPVSRAARPKQMMKVGRNESLLDATYARAKALAGENVLVVGTAKLGKVIREDLPDLPEDKLVLEPEGRDTAACVGLAAVHVARSSPDDVIVMMPADHIVEPTEAFVRVAKTAAAVAAQEKCLVTIGIVPKFAATGYGYVHRGEAVKAANGRDMSECEGAKAYRVRAFREKPGDETAKRYVDSGEYYWNAGIFAWTAGAILAEIEEHLPEHHAKLSEIAAAFGTPDEQSVADEVYPTIPRISIDYGVMEKAKSVAVVEADFGWDDVGSWTAFAEHVERDADGNAVEGEFLGIDARECVVIGHGGGAKLVAAVGVEGLVIVDTPDALLVMPRARDQDVKKVVAKLKELGRTELL